MCGFGNERGVKNKNLAVVICEWSPKEIKVKSLCSIQFANMEEVHRMIYGQLQLGIVWCEYQKFDDSTTIGAAQK